MISSVVGYSGFKSYGYLNIIYLGYQSINIETSLTLIWNLARRRLTETIMLKPLMKSLMAKSHYQTLGDLTQYTIKILLKLSKQPITKFPQKTKIQWVFSIDSYKFRIVNYEYTHNPDLHKHTRLGRIEEMRKTAQAGSTTGPAFGQTNTLSMAGQTQVNFPKQEYQ